MSERLVSLTLRDGSHIRDCPLMLSARDMAVFLNFDSVNQFHQWRQRVGIDAEPATRKYSTFLVLKALAGVREEVYEVRDKDPGIAALDEAGL